DDRIGAELGTTYVALDLETTGLDLENDEIIEVGAVRFNADGVIDSFQTLTNPGRLISPPVVELTGITDEAVRSAPAIWSVADAEAARMLFLALRERCAALAPEVLGQVDQWLALTTWPSRRFFREISEVAVVRASGTLGSHRQPTHPPEPISPKGKPLAVTEEFVLSALRSAADHPEVFPAFDRRPEQETMTAAVIGALNAEGRLMVEAGTGTGKSLAYLIPAACHAVANGDRVVVSTATINLQEQLLKKDIPGVQRLLDCQEQGTGTWNQDGRGHEEQGARRQKPDKVRACQLKGRRNYLCL